MCTYIRQFNISLVIALIILNSLLFLSGAVTIGLLGKIITEHDHDNSVLNFVFLILASIKGLAALATTYYVGKRVIYFKMLSFWKIYLINLIFYLIISAVLLILKIVIKEDESIKEYQHYETFRTMIMAISIVLISCYILSIIGLLLYKQNLEDQFSESPLNRISDPDSISGELYQNIIDQSKDPDNVKLKDEYRRLSKNKMKINSDAVY